MSVVKHFGCNASRFLARTDPTKFYVILCSSCIEPSSKNWKLLHSNGNGSGKGNGKQQQHRDKYAHRWVFRNSKHSSIYARVQTRRTPESCGSNYVYVFVARLTELCRNEFTSIVSIFSSFVRFSVGRSVGSQSTPTLLALLCCLLLRFGCHHWAVATAAASIQIRFREKTKGARKFGRKRKIIIMKWFNTHQKLNVAFDFWDVFPSTVLLDLLLASSRACNKIQRSLYFLSSLSRKHIFPTPTLVRFMFHLFEFSTVLPAADWWWALFEQNKRHQLSI